MGRMTDLGWERLVDTVSGASIASKAVAVAVALLIFYQVFASSKRKTFPTWAPIEIALTVHLVSAGGLGRRIYSLVRRYRGSLFGITTTHQVLYDLPGVDRLFSVPHHTLDVLPLGWTMVVRIFGGEDNPKVREGLNTHTKPLLAAVERLFVNDVGATAALQRADVPRKTAELVSFAEQRKEMKLWERAADVRVVSPPDAATGLGVAVEANMHSLLRDFGACIAIPLLYGQDFVDRYPTLLSDFWTFDNDIFPLLMIGVPSWAPLKIMRDGLAARSRLLEQMRALYKRVDQYQKGEPVDFGADMSDISQTALERNKIYTEIGFPYRARGDTDHSLLWGQNANTQPLLFWFLLYIYSTPGLLDELRREIEPYVKASAEGPNHPTQIMSFDIQSLSRDCPLLKSTLFETFRLANEPTSIRYVGKPLAVRDGAHTHHLPEGSWVSAPHGVIQKDPGIFPEPDKFIPSRFIEEDAEMPGRRVARYGRLKPWGTGVGICKGRTFAEKEILAIGAAVISLWDFEPAVGKWKVPRMRPGTGVMRPVEDVRVVIRRRVIVD